MVAPTHPFCLSKKEKEKKIVDGKILTGSHLSPLLASLIYLSITVSSYQKKKKLLAVYKKVGGFNIFLYHFLCFTLSFTNHNITCSFNF